LLHWNEIWVIYSWVFVILAEIGPFIHHL